MGGNLETVTKSKRSVKQPREQSGYSPTCKGLKDKKQNKQTRSSENVPLKQNHLLRAKIYPKQQQPQKSWQSDLFKYNNIVM